MSRAERASIEAADWLAAQADGPLTAEEQARFDAWLAASDGNKAAYWRMELGWEEADRVGALGQVCEEFASAPRNRPWLREWAPAAMAASVALIISALVAGNWLMAPDRGEPVEVAAQSYSTSLGETQMVDLGEGSRLQLNTRSKLRTRFSASRREVWLDEGEAYFEVAHVEGRPFIVHAGDRQVTVLGTQFSVRRAEERVVVTVLEGRVQLDELEGRTPVRSAIITSGNIAVASGAATLVTARSDENVRQALSWREGMLVFDQEPLHAISEEFNRYNARKLVPDGQSVGSIRITGTFPSDRPDAFARLLREAYGLQVEDIGQEIRISR